MASELSKGKPKEPAKEPEHDEDTIREFLNASGYDDDDIADMAPEEMAQTFADLGGPQALSEAKSAGDWLLQNTTLETSEIEQMTPQQRKAELRMRGGEGGQQLASDEFEREEMAEPLMAAGYTPDQINAMDDDQMVEAWRKIRNQRRGRPTRYQKLPTIGSLRRR